MLEKFQSLNVVQSNNVPTLLAYDANAKSFVIGEEAKTIAGRHQPVAQAFKLAIGESDSMFEGRFVASAKAKPQRLWDILPNVGDADKHLSTRDVTKAFLQQFFAQLGL